MSVRVKIFHAELRRIVNNAGEVRVEGTTVGECLGNDTHRVGCIGENCSDVRWWWRVSQQGAGRQFHRIEQFGKR